MDNYRLRLSKFLSYMLRHAPGDFGLTLDENGYADLEKVLAILRQRFKQFEREDLDSLVESDLKGRFEIADGKIRATYGHTVDVTPKAKSIMPPDILYHGTSNEALDKIRAEGLKPMQRQYVHLSLNEKDARTVGLRHTKDPVILKIRAKEAASDGIEFFKEGRLFLTRSIPAKYIDLDARSHMD